MDDLAFLSALELAGLIAAGEVSAVELVEIYLERIERLDPELGAYVTVRAEEALAEARAGDGSGPFGGVPIALKDLDSTAGTRTTFGSRAFANYVPQLDLAHVRRLKAAGFIVLGKTATPEFGTTAFTESELTGATRNPWDTRRTVGGSSGGAAAAVAAGLAPIAQGSDGGGSIRIPASCCGVFGLKPSRGRISNAPFGPGIGLSTTGPLTRTVADAAAYLDVAAGYEWGDPWSAPPPERPFAAEVGADPGRLRIAFTTEPPSEAEVDPICRAAAEDAAALLASLGHEVEEAAPDWGGPGLIEDFTPLWQVAPTLYGVEDFSLLTPFNQALAEGAKRTSSAEYVAALVRLQMRARRVVAFWERYDLLVTPTLALPPVPIGWAAEAEDPWEQYARAARFTPFTPLFNVTGQPAASLPLHWSAEGLPIGVQLVGAPAGEALLLRVCAQLEAARPWAQRRPPVS